MQLIAGLTLAALTLGQVDALTPIQKVLQMLTNMKTKGEKEVEIEKKTFAKFNSWTHSQTKELEFELKQAREQEDELDAAISKASDDKKRLGEQVTALDSEIDSLEARQAAADKLRDNARKQFMEVRADYAQSLDALERAIQVLKTQDSQAPDAQSLLQNMAEKMPGMRRVLAFLQQEDTGAPSASAYKLQSTSIVTMLEGLAQKFKQELDQVEVEEAKKANAAQEDTYDLRNALKQLKADRQEKASMKASRISSLKKSESDLAELQEDMSRTKIFRDELKAESEAKALIFQANQKVRRSEIKAITKAIEIISSPELAKSYATHVNLAQREVPTLLQLHSQSSAEHASAQGRVAIFLKAKAEALSSSTLSSAAADLLKTPFTKVIQMIEQMLAKLKDEAAAEANHKEWCDKQLQLNTLKREKKTAKLKELSAQVEEVSSTMAEMGEGLSTLSSEVAIISQTMKDATAQRDEEKAENEAAIADATAGVHATKQAMKILREFYAGQSSLIQKGSIKVRRQKPEFDEYKGMQGTQGSVVGQLEVIETDFSRVLANMKAAEQQAKEKYDVFMREARDNKRAKIRKQVQRKIEKDKFEFEKSQILKDVKAMRKELKEANEFYENLRLTCLKAPASYEERVSKRKEEIEALENAYRLLDSKSN